MRLLPDYKLHPAFSDLSEEVSSIDVFSNYFTDLDKLWQYSINNIQGKSIADISTEFLNEQWSLLDKTNNYLDLFASNIYKETLIKALNASAHAILREITYKYRSTLYVKNISSKAVDIKSLLETEAVVGFYLDPSDKRKIASALSPFMRKLREDCKKNNGARCFIAIPAYGEDWSIIKKVLDHYHIETAISAFSGYPLELVGYALTYSYPHETWYTKCYEDLDLSLPNTVQLHFDEDNISAKSMLYLNDVGVENGPFSYIPRNAFPIDSRSQISFFKYLDYAHVEFQNLHGYSQGLYNRALFGVPELRSNFARLPKELQGSSCLGDDILDSSLLSSYLIEQEKKVLSSDASLAIFAGGETLHRGGVVKSGERWALQMMYKDPPSIKDRLTQQIRRKFKPIKNIFRAAY